MIHKKNDPRKFAQSADKSTGYLFSRVTSILEQARANVLRFVNSNLVLAYWLIGREIVQEMQGGEERAEHVWQTGH